MNIPIPAIDPRSAVILDSIKAVFAAKGFDGASMQDLARAAGMSAGNFYRYFPSKDAIIAAIVARDLDEVRAEFNEIIGSARPQDAFSALIRRRIVAKDSGHNAIFAEISAAASRRPEIATLMLRFETEILGYLATVFGRIAGVGPIEAQARFGAHGRLVMLLIHGLSLRGCGTTGGPARVADQELAELVLATIERTVAEIALAAPANTPEAQPIPAHALKMRA